MTEWTLDQFNGALQVRTDVDGVAGRLGHRLTLTVERWHGEVSLTDGVPRTATLTADLTSLVVDSGEGGVTPLTGAERATARSNALKTLAVKKFPRVVFRADTVDATDTGYRLNGVLEIHDRRRDHGVDITVSDNGPGWTLSCRSEVRQSDFGIKPYSMMMGAMKVADVVTVIFDVNLPKP